MSDGAVEIPGVLGRICRTVRTRLDETASFRRGREFESRVASARPRGDRFRMALAAEGSANVIAECKRTSPSRGRLCDRYDPAELSRAYARGGAAAISVLTEPDFFEGSLEHLEQVREAVELPILRKDFILDAVQIDEARACGADAVLLIVAALDDPTLARLYQHADSSGLAVLVEVHDAEELARAIDCGATILGVNNRDLRTLETNPQTARRLAAMIPSSAVPVCESGISTPAAVREFRALGYRGFLVGEHLMRSGDPEASLRALRGETP
ncbi:MAG: Indole-3-glycerol phosphate synthase [Planctomycetota bacterium]